MKEPNPPSPAAGHPLYTDEWSTLGLVSSAEIAEDVAELARGEDPSPEHYRWRRFVKFLKARAVIDAAMATSLYELGERDPDRPMGEAMMSTVLRRDDCPRELLEKAARSSSAFFKRLAAARLDGKRG